MSCSGACATLRPVGDHDHVVGGLAQLGQRVAGDQHRAALAGQRAQEVPQPADALRVQAVGGLVEHQHLRVADQRGREAEPLAHAQRVAARAPVGRVRERDELESSSTRWLPIPAALASVRRWLRPLRPGCSMPPSSTAPTVCTGSSRVVNGCPCTVAAPDVGFTSPSSILNVVVLPAPLGPRKPVTRLVHREREVVDGFDGPEVLREARHLDRVCHRSENLAGSGPSGLSDGCYATSAAFARRLMSSARTSVSPVRRASRVASTTCAGGILFSGGTAAASSVSMKPACTPTT